MLIADGRWRRQCESSGRKGARSARRKKAIYKGFSTFQRFTPRCDVMCCCSCVVTWVRWERKTIDFHPRELFKVWMMRWDWLVGLRINVWWYFHSACLLPFSASLSSLLPLTLPKAAEKCLPTICSIRGWNFKCEWFEPEFQDQVKWEGDDGSQTRALWGGLFMMFEFVGISLDYFQSHSLLPSSLFSAWFSSQPLALTLGKKPHRFTSCFTFFNSIYFFFSPRSLFCWFSINGGGLMMFGVLASSTSSAVWGLKDGLNGKRKKISVHSSLTTRRRGDVMMKENSENLSFVKERR